MPITHCTKHIANILALPDLSTTAECRSAERTTITDQCQAMGSHSSWLLAPSLTDSGFAYDAPLPILDDASLTLEEGLHLEQSPPGSSGMSETEAVPAQQILFSRHGARAWDLGPMASASG